MKAFFNRKRKDSSQASPEITGSSSSATDNKDDYAPSVFSSNSATPLIPEASKATTGKPRAMPMTTAGQLFRAEYTPGAPGGRVERKGKKAPEEKEKKAETSAGDVVDKASDAEMKADDDAKTAE